MYVHTYVHYMYVCQCTYVHTVSYMYNVVIVHTYLHAVNYICNTGTATVHMYIRTYCTLHVHIVNYMYNTDTVHVYILYTACTMLSLCMCIYCTLHVQCCHCACVYTVHCMYNVVTVHVYILYTACTMLSLCMCIYCTLHVQCCHCACVYTVHCMYNVVTVHVYILYTACTMLSLCMCIYCTLHVQCCHCTFACPVCSIVPVLLKGMRYDDSNVDQLVGDRDYDNTVDKMDCMVSGFAGAIVLLLYCSCFLLVFVVFVNRSLLLCTYVCLFPGWGYHLISTFLFHHPIIMPNHHKPLNPPQTTESTTNSSFNMIAITHT